MHSSSLSSLLSSSFHSFSHSWGACVRWPWIHDPGSGKKTKTKQQKQKELDRPVFSIIIMRRHLREGWLKISNVFCLLFASIGETYIYKIKYSYVVQLLWLSFLKPLCLRLCSFTACGLFKRLTAKQRFVFGYHITSAGAGLWPDSPS